MFKSILDNNLLTWICNYLIKIDLINYFPCLNKIDNCLLNLVYMPDANSLYISSKFNDEYDIIIKFSKCMFNDLMTFSDISLSPNVADIPDLDITRTAGNIGLNHADSDNIGPYKMVGVIGFFGGNHGFEGSLIALTSNYTAGDNVMDVADGSQFVIAGGYARTDDLNIFHYNGVTGNQLTGITGLELINLTTDNSVRLYNISAKTNSYKFYADDVELSIGEKKFCNNVKVDVFNELYDCSTLNYTTGLMDVAFYENVIYNVSFGSIDITLENEFKKDVDLSVYYGMQLLNAPFIENIYFAHAENTALQVRTNGLTSGDSNIYPCEKVILFNSDKSICCSMWFDPNCDYSLGRTTYIDNTDPLFWTNGWKIYHWTIGKINTFLNGQKVSWHGVYTFFKNQPLLVGSFAYCLFIGGQAYMAFDFHNTGIEEIIIDELFEFQTMTLIKKDDTIDVSVNNCGKFTVVATGYGTGLYKLD